VKPAALLPEQLLQLTPGTPGCEPLQEPNASVGAQDCAEARCASSASSGRSNSAGGRATVTGSMVIPLVNPNPKMRYQHGSA
jgi:hypothetical protein